MAQVILKAEGETLICKPAGYLGSEFSEYLTATGAAGLRFDGRRRAQVGAVRALPNAITKLESAGFEVALDPSAVEAMRPMVESAREREAAIDESLAEVDAMMARTGNELFTFQRAGVRWIRSMESGALLADDMGLGKTIQAIMAVPTGAPVLVIAPAVAKWNWRNEINKFRPDFRVEVLSGKGSFRWPAPGEVVIINYDVLHGTTEGKYSERRFTDIEPPHAGTWAILDEIQLVKNWRSKRGERAAAITYMVREAGGYTLGLTGTPLLNQRMELWQLLSILGLHWKAFGTWKNFDRTIGYDNADSDSARAALRQVMLRRKKEDVLTDLPAKRYQDIEIPVPTGVRVVLDELVERYGVDFVTPADDVNLAQMIDVSEWPRIMRLLGEAAIPSMLEMVEDYEANGTPLVVFASNRAPIDLLAQREGWVAITGDTSPEQRTQIVADFQAGKYKGLAATIRAAGVAITATFAANALFVQLDWTPANNAQAEDRIYRIGQTRGVLIQRLVLDHPLIHRVHEVLDRKQRLIGATIEESCAAPEEVLATDSSLAAAINLEALADRAKAVQPIESPLFDAALRAKLFEGRFATTANEGHTAFWKVDMPTEGRWAGWIFVKQQVGPTFSRFGAVRPDQSVTNVGVITVLARIAEDAAGAAVRYGQELGVCGVCGLPLTNEESRERGIGPICAARVGI